MADRGEVAHTTTESLIYQQPRRRFVTKLAPEHWQLRSLLGTDDCGDIYHPGGVKNRQISKLNIHSLSYEHIRTLTFAPKCLASKNGYVCVGGEQGELVIVSPQASVPPEQEQAHTRDDVDRLLAAERRWWRGSNYAGRGEDDIRRNAATIPGGEIVYKPKQIGEQRINCITLWFPPDKHLDVSSSVRYRKPVAVLATNDMHVTIVDLESEEVIETLRYPDCVNRAVLSPDGRLLVAVCDDPYLYIRERIRLVDTPDHRGTGDDGHQDTDSSTEAATALFECEWRPCERIALRSQIKGDRTDNKGSFAACFSNTGEYLAVGTQYGTISIFKVAALTDPDTDPLLSCFQTTTPRTKEGAVRDMAFCPGSSLDLLAWSEHADTVGIADIRHECVSWQILSLKDGFDFDLHHVRDDAAINPRLLQSIDGLATNASFSIAPGTGESTQSSNARWRQRVEDITDNLRRASALQDDIHTELEGLRASQNARRDYEEGMVEMLERSRAGMDELDRLINDPSQSSLPDSVRLGEYQTVLELLHPHDSTTSQSADRSSAQQGRTPGTTAPRRTTSSSVGHRSGSANAPETVRSQRQLEDLTNNSARARRYIQAQAQARALAATASTGHRVYGDRPTSYQGSVGTLSGTSLSSTRARNTDIAATSSTAATPTTSSGLTSRARDPLASSHTATSSNRSARRTSGWAELDALNSVLDDLEQPTSGPVSQAQMQQQREIQRRRQNMSTEVRATPTHDSTAPPAPSSRVMSMRTERAATLARTQQRPRHGEDLSTETAGLVWSHNGQKLYVAAQNGIYEFQVNTFARRQYPEIVLR